MVRGIAPVIFGCSGYSLTSEEIEFFKKHNPLGFILFRHNINENNPLVKDQVKTLVAQLKSTVSHTTPSILIDQEGGRVLRLRPPTWTQHPPARMVEKTESLENARIRVRTMYSQIVKDLKELGITVNCAPVLDLDVFGSDPIMADRTFSHDPLIVSELGGIAIQVMKENGITPVMKHIPGHGAARSDSHKTLPVVDLSLKELLPHFAPFKANATCPWAMTAHILYTSLDPNYPATQSPYIIQEIIRGTIGFKGFLISDDIGMEALSGSFAERTRKALEAGCDAVLHCSGILEEMMDVMKGVQ